MLLKRVLLAIASENFDTTFFCASRATKAFLSRQKVLPVLNWLAQARYQPAIKMLERFEAADYAYHKLMILRRHADV